LTDNYLAPWPGNSRPSTARGGVPRGDPWTEAEDALVADLNLPFSELVARLPKRSRAALHQRRHYARKAATKPSEPLLDIGAEVRWGNGRQGIVTAVSDTVVVLELRRLGPPIEVALPREALRVMWAQTDG
jgi:hypothetical protein